MVKGLPSTATDEDAIMEFFKEHAVKGKTDTEIVKVVIGWDIEEFRENISKLKELKKRLDEKDSSDPEVKNIKAEMVQITAALKSAGTKAGWDV
ncbi:CBP3 [Symbiodinium sp. CCMP2592]|nr:CBP3 [Symbiodinium sp. CCMP2592]